MLQITVRHFKEILSLPRRFFTPQFSRMKLLNNAFNRFQFSIPWFSCLSGIKFASDSWLAGLGIAFYSSSPFLFYTINRFIRSRINFYSERINELEIPVQYSDGIRDLNDSWKKKVKWVGEEVVEMEFNYDNNKVCDEILIEFLQIIHRFATVIRWPMKNAKSCDYFPHKGSVKRWDVAPWNNWQLASNAKE